MPELHKLATPVLMMRAISVSAICHAVVLLSIDVTSVAEKPPPFPATPIINLQLATEGALDDGAFTLEQLAGEVSVPRSGTPEGESASADGLDAPKVESIPTTFVYVWEELRSEIVTTGTNQDAVLGSDTSGDADAFQDFQVVLPSRIRRLQANSTLQTDEAIYLNRWQAKVESVGSLYLPSNLEVLAGKVVVMTQINASGRLRDVRVLVPSAHYELDLAALQILRLAAPFQPFSPDMADQYDVLQIVREWNFLGLGEQSINWQSL